MGYTLRAFVLNDREQMEQWLPRYYMACDETDSADFRGYGDVWRAMLTADSDSANAGFKALVQGHMKQSKGRGVFAGTEAELLCIWGVGLANLARSRGLQVSAVPPLIPADLLI